MNQYFVFLLFLFFVSASINAEDFEIDLRDKGCGGFKKLKNKEKSFLNQFQSAENESSHKKDLTEEQKDLIVNLIHREPTFTEVQAQVYRFFAVPTGQEFNDLRKKIRKRNFLPVISSDSGFSHDLDKVRNNDNDYSTSLTRQNADIIPPPTPTATYNNNDLNQSSGNYFGVTRRNYWDTGVKVEFNLPNTVYDDEETDLFSEIRRFAPIRQDLGEQAQSAYFERRKKEISFILNPATNEAEQIIQNLEIEEYTAKLDSLTGGWFSHALKERVKH
jgi:hypothetical protein